MLEYHKLLRNVLENGIYRMDRTGTGTIAVFGTQSRYNLAEGFPIVTTKKLHLKSVIHELLWFIKGDTNVKYLQDNGVTIWDEWCDSNGDLGPIYGHSWRDYGSKPDKIIQPKPRLRSGLQPTYLGVGSGYGKDKHVLGKTWEGMMARCYDINAASYHLYGAKGVYVCDAWLEFSVFAKDAENLPGWELKEKTPDLYVLDKDGLGNGFCYGPRACQWVTEKENQLLKSDKLYTVKRIADGKIFTFTNPTPFCEEHLLENKNFSDLWTGHKNAKVRQGYELVNVERRKTGIDQLFNVIEGLKNNPHSRRHIVSAWNPADVETMALPPCHAFFQFFVDDEDRLSLQLYQRSADVFLGVPFNIASYSLLLMMVAQVTGYTPHEFIHTIGDAHLYANHIEQAKLQLSREPLESPIMKINLNIKSIDDFKYEDFELLNYECYPAIKAEIAV
jgi:thymidylate synthase